MSDTTPVMNAPGNPLFTVKGLARLLYRMGRTFDGLSTSSPATEEFLRTGNPAIIGSKNDLALLTDLNDASRYVIEVDYREQSLDLDWFTGINKRMTRTAAIQPGILREQRNIIVNTPLGTYTPDIPDPSRLDTIIRDADRQASDQPLQQAAILFASLAKAQPFGDGNKRSALLAANGLLIRHHATMMLTVPVEGAAKTTFNHHLANWYLNADPTLSIWLATWNQHDQNNNADTQLGQ